MLNMSKDLKKNVNKMGELQEENYKKKIISRGENVMLEINILLNEINSKLVTIDRFNLKMQQQKLFNTKHSEKKRLIKQDNINEI